MKCEKCNKRVEQEDIKFDVLTGIAKHKRCNGRILKEMVFTSGNQEVFL